MIALTPTQLPANESAQSGRTTSSGWLLAIDSSTEQAGVALFDGERVAEVSWSAGRSQTTSLLGEIDHLLRLHGIGLSDVGAIAVATGPGAFSALRVGAGTAKGLSLARDLPLIGIPTLDVAAAAFAGHRRSVVTVIAAGRGRLVWGIYGNVDGGWRQSGQAINGTPAELRDVCNGAPGELIVTGELSAELVAALSELPGLVIPPVSQRVRRPGALAELAWARWLRHDTDDPAALEPVYLHGR